MEFSLFLNPNEGDLYIQQLTSEMMKTNDLSINYGLVLSENDVKMLIQCSIDSINDNDRIEFGESATLKIVDKFMKSTYISQSCYADTVASLIEIFYEVKEESLGVLTDSEVIDIMFDFFENESGGSIEVLQNRDMSYLCKKVRYAAQNITDEDMDLD